MNVAPGQSAQNPAPHVVVVGGGISGLAAAVALRRQAPHARVTLLEGSSQVGGKLALDEVAGVIVDVGAEAMLNRRPEGVGLAREVGLGERIVHPATTAANLWSRGQLLRMPPTLMGVPTDIRPLAESGLLSRAGATRAKLDAVLPATEIGDSDVSVGWLIEERFGREVVDRLVEPLLGGVYAGHARELSARATVPQVVALLGRDRSMMKAAAALMPPSKPPVDGVPATVPPPLFAGVSGGMGLLALTIAERDDLTVRTDTMARELARRSGSGWNLVVGSAHAPEVLTADAVVLATPAAPTARLLSDVAPDAALELGRVEYASMAIVSLAFRRRDFPETSGSGFLVPPVDGRTIKGATFSFAKWGWVGEAGAEQDVVIMRCSIGRHREETTLQVPDEELVQVALDELSAAIGLSVRPVDTHVQRWGGGLPQYAVGHLDRVARIRGAVERVGSLAVCGAAYEGLGIPACIASGERAAREVVESLNLVTDPEGE